MVVLPPPIHIAVVVMALPTMTSEMIQQDLDGDVIQ
jgi:hypothetical protein